MDSLNIEVKLYGHTVGYLAQDSQKNVVFEYEPAFKQLGLEISPLKLPTATTNLYTNKEDSFFEGLPGVIADSLPDKFGNKIIEKYYANKGINSYELSVLQKLAYIGTTGMGALEFFPNDSNNKSTLEILEIQHLVQEARDVITGKTEKAIPELMESGGSAGGARAKAIIAWDKKNNIVRSGRLDCKEGFEQYIIKFDGVGENGISEDYTKVEYIYMKIAKELGLKVAGVKLINNNGLSHLAVKRFDRINNSKIHMHTLCGLTHTNFNLSGLFSYEQYAQTVYTVTKSIDETHHAIFHMLFNIITRNQDDHTKNFSFLMDENGSWSNSLIYDLTYSYGKNYTKSHQISLNGKRDNFNRDDILKLSRKYNISDKDMNNIIELFVSDFRELFKKYAFDLEINKNKIDTVLNNMRIL